jgi:phospholipase C
MTRGIRRRDALKTMGGIAGAATLGKVLPGCGGGDDGPVGITTIVLLMMENRSYDHYFGARALQGLGGNGLSAGMMNLNRLGAEVPIFEVGGQTSVCVLDPPHGWEGSRAQVNGGAMDGFLVDYQNAHDSDSLTDVMGYLTRDHLPVSWALADAYTTCDNYFCSVLGPTWPNRMYWHTGTSQGITDNSLPEQGFDWESVYHRLAAKGVEYSYYYGDFPVVGILSDEGLPGHSDRIFQFEDFLNHAARGTLSPVVYIDPAFSKNDDHPPHHTMRGQQLIASIYTALATSPQWKNCLFVITYDEHGGYYDHVAPPDDAADEYAAQGFNQLGVRVPTIVIGPYAKQGVVSTRYDHASVLKHLENMFDLDPLYARVDAAADLTDCIDLERLEAGDWNPPAEIPAVEVDESEIRAPECIGEAEKPHAIFELIEKYPSIRKKLSRFDRRDTIEDYLFHIGDYLDRHNQGRIRRGR